MHKKGFWQILFFFRIHAAHALQDISCLHRAEVLLRFGPECFWASPVLPFLVFGKRQGKPPQKPGFVILTEPLKSLEKKGKNAQKNKEILARRKKPRNSSKKKKGTTGSVGLASPESYPNRKVAITKILAKWRRHLETGSRGQILEGGGENFEVPGAPEIDLFLPRFYRKSPIWGVKSPSLRGATFRASSPTSSVRYV